MDKENLGKYIFKNIRWIIFYLSLIIFVIILKELFQNDIQHFDDSMYWFVSNFMSDKLTSVMKVITNLGSAGVIIAITVILFIKNRKKYKILLLDLLIIVIFNQFLKLIIARPRPSNFMLIKQGGYSFPSGHSMVGMAFYGLLIYISYKEIKNKYVKIAICSLLSILIILIGVSRIYLGVHYPSDVIAGFSLALAYLAIFTNITKKYIEKGEGE